MEIHKTEIEKVKAFTDEIRSLEVSQFVLQFIHQPKSIKDFEEQLFRQFEDEELEEIATSTTLAERIEAIIKLLRRQKVIDSKSIVKVKEKYSKEAPI